MYLWLYLTCEERDKSCCVAVFHTPEEHSRESHGRRTVSPENKQEEEGEGDVIICSGVVS